MLPFSLDLRLSPCKGYIIAYGFSIAHRIGPHASCTVRYDPYGFSVGSAMCTDYSVVLAGRARRLLCTERLSALHCGGSVLGSVADRSSLDVA